MPDLDVKIQVAMPTTQSALSALWDTSKSSLPTPPSSSESWQAFTPDALLAICRERLRGGMEWEEILQNAELHGRKAALLWRRGDYMDWVRHTTDVDGKPRLEALASGIALNQVRFDCLQ